MLFGLSIQAFTQFHVIVSLVGIIAGLAVLYGWLHSTPMTRMTAIFLAATAVTVVTGFMFPITAFTPALGVGILTTVLLLVALYALYVRHLSGRWRMTYLITAISSLYFNCFVVVAQSFLKVPSLHALAPNGSEPPFAISQAILLVAFVVAGYFAVHRYHPPMAAA